MRTRTLFILLFAMLGQLLSAQSLNLQQQTLMSDVFTYLKTRNVAIRQDENPAEIFFSEDSINYVLTLHREEEDPMLLELSTTYVMSSEYDAAVLTSVAERLNRLYGVKCVANEHSISFLSQWFLLDYSPFRYSYARIHKQVLKMAGQFGSIYHELGGNKAAGNGITQGPPRLISQEEEPVFDVNDFFVEPAANEAASKPVTIAADQAEETLLAEVRMEPIVINHPAFEGRGKRRLDLTCVTLQPDCTILDLVSYDREETMTYKWTSVSADAYIQVGTIKYRLKSAEKIAVSPKTTYYSASGKLTFRLIFPAVPVGSTTMDFVNDPDHQWYFHNIQLAPRR